MTQPLSDGARAAHLLRAYGRALATGVGRDIDLAEARNDLDVIADFLDEQRELPTREDLALCEHEDIWAWNCTKGCA